jgi:hypothetical protein
MDRDTFLQIETVLGYGPLAPIIGHADTDAMVVRDRS